MCAKTRTSLRRKTLKESISFTPAVMKDIATSFINPVIHNEIARTKDWVDVILQGLVNKAVHMNLKSVNLENRVVHTIENVVSSLWLVTGKTETIWNNLYFSAPVGTVVKKETNKVVEVWSKGEKQHCKFLEATYTTVPRSAPSSNGTATNIFDEQTN